MKKSLKNILTTALIIFGASSFLTASAIPARPQPQRLVNDFAGIFSPRQTQELENMLVAFDDSTSNQITVVTVRTLEGYSASEYATEIGLRWQVGTAGADNGIVLLVKPKTGSESGEVFIAVGYGLEGAIPDAWSKRIISNYLIPKFRQDDYYGGVFDACTVMMKLASGEISEPRGKDSGKSRLPDFIMLALFIAVTVLVVTMAFKEGGGGNGSNGGYGGSGGRRGPDGTFIFFGPGRRPRGPHGGYGGFGGGSPFGGGGSFGGGSSGGGFGGFGGFGGGSFGGGGAGGKW